MQKGWIRAAAAAVGLAFAAPVAAQPVQFEASFDKALGTEVRTPRSFEARYETAFEQRIAELANGSNGRIGIAAVDLSSGYDVAVLEG